MAAQGFRKFWPEDEFDWKWLAAWDVKHAVEGDRVQWDPVLTFPIKRNVSTMTVCWVFHLLVGSIDSLLPFWILYPVVVEGIVEKDEHGVQRIETRPVLQSCSEKTAIDPENRLMTKCSRSGEIVWSRIRGLWGFSPSTELKSLQQIFRLDGNRRLFSLRVHWFWIEIDWCKNSKTRHYAIKFRCSCFNAAQVQYKVEARQSKVPDSLYHDTWVALTKLGATVVSNRTSSHKLSVFQEALSQRSSIVV